MIQDGDDFCDRDLKYHRINHTIHNYDGDDFCDDDCHVINICEKLRHENPDACENMIK
ncbi:MAG: hypothetical protein ACKPFD_08560 [Dolichospermum sp.]